MNKHITIKIKSVYGNTTYYPACESSALFAKLVGQKTLTQSNLSIIKGLGYEIKVAQDELKL